MIYCVAVGQWFLIMQELANIDPDHRDSPLDSMWSKLIQERSRSAAEHAEKLRKSIIATRLKRVSDCRQVYTFDSDLIFYFTDSEVNYTWKIVKGCTDREARKCVAAREEYYRRIETEITGKVKDIATSITTWNELAKYPLPRLEAQLIG